MSEGDASIIKTFENKRNLIFIIYGAVGTALILLSGMNYGPALSTDSAAYLYAAQNFLDGRGFVYFGYESPFIQWPPLYPAVLALTYLTGIKGAYAAMYLNALLFGLIIVFSGIWLGKHVRTPFLCHFGTLTILFSAALYQTASYVWSEPLFILLAILAVLALERYLDGGSPGALVLSALLAAAACMARYSGVTLAAAAVMLLLANGRGPAHRARSSLLHKVRAAFVYGLLAGAPLAAWMLRNLEASGTLMGDRKPSAVSLYQNVLRTLKALAGWVFPLELYSQNRRIYAAVIVLVLALLAAAAVFAVYSAVKAVAKANHADGPTAIFYASGAYGAARHTMSPLSGLPVAAVFTFIYICYLIASATAIAFDPINNRLLSPVFVPLAFVIVSALDSLALSAGRGRIMQAVRLAFAGLLVFWLLYPVFSVGTSVKKAVNEGAGIFTSPQWRGSELAAYAGSLAGSLICSNYPEAIYLHTGAAARYTPKLEPGLPAYGIERFKRDAAASGHTYIVWFDKYTSNLVYNPEELGQYFIIEKIAGFKDGEVYAIK